MYETGDSIVVDMPAGMLRDLFFVTDHLGNVRSVVDVSPDLTEPVILEQDDYLPFGTRVQTPSFAGVDDNRYRYAGKEEQRIGGADLSLLDFGARYYDPYIARWTSIDPMAYKFSSFSPFNYCCGNPIGLYDLDGRIPIVLSIAGVAADYAFQVYLNYNEGITGKDAFTNVDYASLAMSAINPAKKLSFVGKCGVILVKNLTDAAIDTNSEDIVNTNVKDIASKTLTNSLVEGVSSTVGKFIEGKAISSKAATLEASKNYTHKTNLATKSHPSAKSNAEASKAKAEFESAIVAESAYDALNKTTYLYTPITEREIKKQLNEDTRH